jgi:hypothetical protein
MAQDVLKIAPHAVVEGKDGYLRVNYGALGLRMATYRQWLADPETIRSVESSLRNHKRHIGRH